MPRVIRVSGNLGTDGHVRFPRSTYKFWHFRCANCDSTNLIFGQRTVERKRHQRHSHKLKRTATCKDCGAIMAAGYGPIRSAPYQGYVRAR